MPRRRTSDLRKGRVSISGARYFITCSAVRPTSVLVQEKVTETIFAAIQESQTAGDFDLLASTVMPDHVHLLVRLGDRLNLPRVMAKFKTKTKIILDRHHAAWQENFFEHRLRPDDQADAFARYIFLNPYRAGLIPRNQTWPYWKSGLNVDFDFIHLLEDQKFPPKEWMETKFEELGVREDFVGECT